MITGVFKKEIYMTPLHSRGLKIAVVNFIPKFVAMATGVGRGETLMTLSDSPNPKIGR